MGKFDERVSQMERDENGKKGERRNKKGRKIKMMVK